MISNVQPQCLAGGKLVEVKKSLENIMDDIENMGYAKYLQQRYDERRHEEEELLLELAVQEALKSIRVRLRKSGMKHLEMTAAVSSAHHPAVRDENCDKQRNGNALLHVPVPGWFVYT